MLISGRGYWPLVSAAVLSLLLPSSVEATKYSKSARQLPLLVRVEDKSGLDKISLAEIPRLLSAIHPGMGRADVERLMLEPDDGPQPEKYTRYRWGVGFVILVPFDQTSGLWEPQNKVNGLPKLILQ